MEVKQLAPNTSVSGFREFSLCVSAGKVSSVIPPKQNA